jgi:hypothetical protein
VVSGTALVWLTLAIGTSLLPFDAYKQHRIGTIASVFGLILAMAAYRQPIRRRGMTHVAITLAGLTFTAYFLFPPL